MIEELSDLAQAHPEAVDRIPALTLARALTALPGKITAPRGGGRRGETVFNHNNGGFTPSRASLRISRSFTPDSESSPGSATGYERG